MDPTLLSPTSDVPTHFLLPLTVPPLAKPFNDLPPIRVKLRSSSNPPLTSTNLQPQLRSSACELSTFSSFSVGSSYLLRQQAVTARRWRFEISHQYLHRMR
ncbi:hypothetical protein TIFTF001_025859 [Ficus carica]|uniref:Uncharacterized protein n=1 Tax=Ficus carica TaxID=3494 RepID=A0AA88AXF5_FICCA|nr:hypothetical protein TIFTF001_025859 [Ficus carica]